MLEAASMLKRLSGRRHKVWTSTGLIVHNSVIDSLKFNISPELIFGEWLGYIWTEYSTVEIEELGDDSLHQLLQRPFYIQYI